MQVELVVHKTENQDPQLLSAMLRFIRYVNGRIGKTNMIAKFKKAERILNDMRKEGVMKLLRLIDNTCICPRFSPNEIYKVGNGKLCWIKKISRT